MSFKLEGVFPALITPMGPGDALNFPVNHDAMNKLIDHVIDREVSGVVPVGCTGHAASLTHKEQVDLIDRVNRHVDGRVPVLAGDGSNCTREAIGLAKRIEDIGVDIHMQISPYQNKPTQEGLFQHYSMIANAINGILIVYNVPGRTSVNILPETAKRLAEEHSNIIGIKEASGDMGQIQKVIELTRDIDTFNVVSGDDGLTYDIMKAGGKGVISVAANLHPAPIVEMVKLALSGDFEGAKKISNELQPLFNVLFIETNPSPLHYALQKTGIDAGVPRLPLVELTHESKKKVDDVLKHLGII